MLHISGVYADSPAAVATADTPAAAATARRDDVWFVTMTQALYWMTDPIPINQLAQLDQWDCRKRKDIPDPACNLPNTCRISFKPPKDGDAAWVPGTRWA